MNKLVSTLHSTVYQSCPKVVAFIVIPYWATYSMKGF